MSLSVRLYMYVNTITFESLDVGLQISGWQPYLECIRAKSVYKGHRVNVNVTAVKSAKFHIPAM